MNGLSLGLAVYNTSYNDRSRRPSESLCDLVKQNLSIGLTRPGPSDSTRSHDAFEKLISPKPYAPLTRIFAGYSLLPPCMIPMMPIHMSGTDVKAVTKSHFVAANELFCQNCHRRLPCSSANGWSDWVKSWCVFRGRVAMCFKEAIVLAMRFRDTET